MDKPLKYYSRKMLKKKIKEASRTSVPKRPRVVHNGFIGNKYDKFTGPELMKMWESARDKLNAMHPISERLANILKRELDMIQTAKNWIK